jgi:hypothetical protein
MRNTMKNRTGISAIVSAALLASALSACGGGGGSAVAASTTSFNLQTGFTGLVTSGQTANVTLSGSVTSNGSTIPFTGSGTLTLAPAMSSAFNGAAALAQTETISGTVSATGQTIPYSSSVVDYYASGNDAFVGETGNNEFDVAQSPFIHPATVVDGSAGTLGTTSNYTDASMGVSQGMTQVSYRVTVAVTSGTAAQVAVTDKVYDTQNNLVETDVTNYSLTTGGVLSFVSATVQNASDSLTVTAQ